MGPIVVISVIIIIFSLYPFIIRDMSDLPNLTELNWTDMLHKGGTNLAIPSSLKDIKLDKTRWVIITLLYIIQIQYQNKTKWGLVKIHTHQNPNALERISTFGLFIFSQ